MTRTEDQNGRCQAVHMLGLGHLACAISQMMMGSILDRQEGEGAMPRVAI